MWQKPCTLVCLVVTLAVCVNGARIGDVRLRGGVSNAERAYGRVEVWMPGWYTICDTLWDEKDANVVCRQLNYTYGMPLCCDSVGYNYYASARMDYVVCKGNETRITDCTSEEPRPHHRFCHLRSYASALCTKAPRKATYSSVRIGTAIQPSGDVILNYTNINGSICSDGWDDADARVACREAGYPNGTAYTHYRGVANGPFWTSNVNCIGNESRLSDCDQAGFGNVSRCNSGHHAGALCYAKGLEFRLAGDPDPLKGRFEVSIDGVWGTVCNASWNTPDVTVFCRQIGYAGGSVSRETYQGAPLKMYTTGMACLGLEKNLLSCPHTGWSEVTEPDRRCPNHSYDVSITCHGPVRLVASQPNPVHGPIMFYRNTYWSLVCDEDFNDFTAKLACVSMGFVDGRAICCSAYGPGRFQSSFKVSCTGNETSIQECVREVTCRSSNYVSVVCFKKKQIPISEAYRFSVHREHDAHGQVTVRHYGVTGRICYQHWTDSEARVLCKSLGHRSGIAYHHTLFGQTRDAAPYMVSNVTCMGNETSVSECQFNGRLELGDCTAQHMAGSLCLNESDTIQYRLADGGYNYGRVEVGVDGEWGTICTTWWGYSEARVLCKQLGFVTGGRPTSLGNITQGNGTIWLSHLQCDGTEETLHACRHVGFDTEVSDLYGRYPDGRIVYYPACNSERRSDAAVFCFENPPNTTTPIVTTPIVTTTPRVTTRTKVTTTPRVTTTPILTSTLTRPTTSLTRASTRLTTSTRTPSTTRSIPPTPPTTPITKTTPPFSTSATTRTTTQKPPVPVASTTSPSPTTTSKETSAPPGPPSSTRTTRTTLKAPVTGETLSQEDEGVHPAAIAIPIVIILLIICAIIFFIMFTARRRQRKDPFHHDRLHEDNSVGFHNIHEDSDLPAATGNWNNNANSSSSSNGPTPNGNPLDYVFYNKDGVHIGTEVAQTPPIDPLYNEVYVDHGIVNPGYNDDTLTTDPTLPVPEQPMYYTFDASVGSQSNDSTI